jgi:hypothetical protein
MDWFPLRLARVPALFRRLCLGAAGAVCLLACDALDHEALTARTVSAPQGMTCSGCHAYPLMDMNHAYHLLNADTARISKNINGSITCLDCHRGSMASREFPILDSICADNLKPSGWSSLDEGEDFAKCLAKFPLARVDTIRQHRPVPLPERPGEVPLLQEWMTGVAHMNGTVDVEFDPRVSDTLESPAGAAWDPEAMTCSAVACHEHHGHYRWAVPSRGLTGLRGHHVE